MLIRVVLFILAPFILSAQLPSSDIYLFNMTNVGDEYRLSSPRYLTAFNSDGYNNQPAFFEDDVIYFSTNYYDKERTEIAKFDLFDEILTRITYTEEKEYSPLKVPGSESFSVVRVEKDDITQTLSVYPLDGIGYAKRYMNNTINIGYHVWLDNETLGLFLVEEPNHNLAVSNALSERRKIVLDKVGRCLKKNKDGNLLFVHKLGDQDWYIKAYNPSTSKSTEVAKTLPGAEDFELLSDGSIIMGSGSKLFRYNNEQWTELFDLSYYGINNLNRIAVRKNKLVVVANSN